MKKPSLLLTIGRTWLRQQADRGGAEPHGNRPGEVALRIGDDLTRSYALGFLGELYEAGGRPRTR